MKENNINNKKELEIKTKEIKYNEEVKEYLNNHLEEKNYGKFIEENPDELFESMDIMKFNTIELALFKSSYPSIQANDEDILSVELNLAEQQVIKNDCHRTRVRESFLIPGYSKILEAVLTYYCNTKKICYKQGLNEIFGALILLRYKFKNMKLSKLFDIGEVFIDQYLPNYFYEK